MNNSQALIHISNLLSIAKEILHDTSLIHETGETNVKGDRSIEMDVAVEKAFLHYVQENNLPVTVFSEEIGTVTYHPKPEFLLAFDPLDGSTNYKVGKGLLPFGTLIALYKGTTPLLKDVIAAGAFEYSRDLGWLYDGEIVTDFSCKRVVLDREWTINKSAPLYLDLYYKEGYELYSVLPEKIFVRNTGSTIGNLSYTLENVATGLGGICMRAEEIGAVYSLIKGAGGKVTDNQGVDLGERVFNPESTYPILGGAPKVVEYVLNLLK